MPPRPKGFHRAETPRRGGPESFFSAPQPLCASLFPAPIFVRGLHPSRQIGQPLTTPSASIRGSPSPTSTTLCHAARGCAVPGATPGPGRSAFPTPQGVVPFVPAGGCDIKGRNGIRFTGAEEESARKECPISPQYTHLTCHRFEPSAQPRWGCLCLWPSPGVAPRRRNPGLHGRIPLGFPEGRWATCNLGDSRRGNGDRPPPAAFPCT